MAVQTVAAIECLDPLNPKELQAWFTAHPLVIVTAILRQGNSFVVIYT